MSAYADSDKALIVVLTNGSEIKFALADKPELSFNSSSRSLLIDVKSQYNSFEIDLVKEFYFAKAHVGIEQVLQEESLVVTSQTDNAITIEGLRNNEHVGVFSIDGKQMPASTDYNTNQVTISLESLPKGVYLIKIGNRQTFKINRK